MNKLTKIANKYNTDKGTNVVCDNNCKGHGFTEFYYKYFKTLKNPKILEIGTYKGNSVKMFFEFFKGECEIYTIDIDPKCHKELPINGGDKIHFELVDQSNKDQLNDFTSKIGSIKFDIILDDGSHEIYHQMLTYSILKKLLKPNGMYIIEDLHTSFGEHWHYNQKYDTSTLDFFINFKPFNMFSDELNFELLNEIKTVELFSNNNNSIESDLNNIRRNRSITAIIKLKNDE